MYVNRETKEIKLIAIDVKLPHTVIEKMGFERSKADW
jgi:hypothetical protein